MNHVCTSLCLNAYLSPKASCRFGMRTGPWPLRVLAERTGPKPGGMSFSPGAFRPPKPGGMSGSPGAFRTPKPGGMLGSPGACRTRTPPHLAEACMSTPCLVLCVCIIPHADVLLMKHLQWSAVFLSKAVTCFSNSLMLVALSKLCPNWYMLAATADTLMEGKQLQ